MQISSPSSTSLFDTLSENLLSKKTNETEGSSFDSLIERKEDSSVIIHKETTENLVKDLMSLLKTGFTEQELKDIEEILRKLEALNKDKSSGKSDSLTDIENRIKQLREHLKEAQEKATGRSARNLDTDTILNSEIKTYDSKENLNNIKDGSVLKENQLIVASASEQLRLLEQLKQTKK